MNIKKMKQPAHGKKTTVINLKQLTATTILLLGSSLVTTAHSQIIEQKSNSSPIDNQPNSTKTGFENIVFTDATNINPTHSEPATPSITDDLTVLFPIIKALASGAASNASGFPRLTRNFQPT